MAHEVRRVHVQLKLLVALSLMIWSSSTHGNLFSATAMTIDQAISAAATASSQGAVSRPEHFSNSQPDIMRVELDMIFRPEDFEAIKRTGEAGTGRYRRKALRNENFRWPNAEIPYQLSLQLAAEERTSFQAALADYHHFTCVRFRQATSNDRSYVNIVSDVGCYSYVGRQQGDVPQLLSLSPGCRHKSTIIHELAHALGFHHEQTRPDRDDFVIIKKENIQENSLHNFDRYTTDTVDTRGLPYDYLSVMHYGAKYFSKNTENTIVTKNATYQRLIGTATGFSFNDVKLVNAIYSCSKRNRCRKKTCPSEGFVGQDCQCWCPSGNKAIAAVKCPGCHDYDKFCHAFMNRGMCTKRLFANYMKEICPRACGVCT